MATNPTMTGLTTNAMPSLRSRAEIEAAIGKEYDRLVSMTDADRLAVIPQIIAEGLHFGMTLRTSVLRAKERGLTLQSFRRGLTELMTNAMPPDRSRAEIEAAISKECDRLVSMTDPDFQDAIPHMMADAMHSLVMVGASVRLIKDRGDAVEATRPSIRAWLEALADCRVLPEALHKFCSTPAMMTAVARMPLEVQAAIVDDEPLAVVRLVDGARQVLGVLPSQLEMRDVPQVFGKEGLRDEGQQAEWLLAKAAERERRSSARPARAASESGRAGKRQGHAAAAHP